MAIRASYPTRQRIYRIQDNLSANWTRRVVLGRARILCDSGADSEHVRSVEIFMRLATKGRH